MVGRQQLDLHTGGVDLAFPHHENEIAQCEAAFNSTSIADAADDLPEGREWRQWCNYFVHVGHLHIAGRKMSKSLKNFISIDEYLNNGGPTAACRFRVFCLMHKYNANVHYSEDRIVDAEAVLRRLREFFARAERALGVSADAGSGGDRDSGLAPDCTASPVQARWCMSSRELVQCLEECHHSVGQALSNDLDTPRAMAVLLSAVSRTHAAMDVVAGRSKPGESSQKVQGLWPIVRYIAQQLRLFGLTDEATGAFDSIAPTPAAAATATAAAANAPGNASSSGSEKFDNREVIDGLLRLRAKLRGHAIDGAGLDKAELWEVCDFFRDDILPAMGVKVKDLRDGSYTYTHEMPRKGQGP
eukprot:COSAG05_NODE_2498_length_2979_cov_29.040286_4_plen_358_part_00